MKGIKLFDYLLSELAEAELEQTPITKFKGGEKSANEFKKVIKELTQKEIL